MNEILWESTDFHSKSQDCENLDMRTYTVPCCLNPVHGVHSQFIHKLIIK